MGIGQFRERITIIAINRGQGDNMGGYHSTKDVVKQAWAKVEELTEGRAQETYNTSVTSPMQFTIRAGAYKITSDNLIRWRGIEYKVHSITHDPMRRYQTVLGYGEG